MTRPTKFGPARPQNIISIGGDPDLPAGQPTTDCCADPEDMPDRALDTGSTFVGVTGGDGSLVQSKAATVNGSLASLAYDSDTVLGNLLVAVLVARGGGGGLPSAPTGWTVAGSGGPGASATTRMYYRTAPGGAVTFAVASGPTNEQRVFIAEFDGAASFVDVETVLNHATAGGPCFIGSVDLTQDGVLVGAMTADDPGAGALTFTVGTGYTSINQGGVAGPLNPYTIFAYNAETAGSHGWQPDSGDLDATFGGVLAAFEGGIGWVGGGYLSVDGDDATYTEISGPNVIRIDLGAPFEIARIRLLIGTENSGSKSYTLKGANEADFSDAVTVTTLAWTATGSFTADEVTDSWAPTDAYQFWELTGADETRYVYSFELYEAGAQDASSVAADLADHLTDPTDAHDASAVSIVDSGGYYTGTDVEAALQELGAGGAGGGIPSGWFNVEDYGAVHDGTTDDTSSIQDAIDACFAAGGGTIFFPAGIYQLDGALQDTSTYNSQLEIPYNAVDHSGGSAVIIKFLGANVPYTNEEQGPASSVLRSSWNGTISGNPAIISCGLHDSLTMNWVILHFENIDIRAHADPKLSAIDATKAGGVRFDNLTLSVYHTNYFAIPLPADWVPPTHSNAVGIDFPRGYDDLYSGGDGLTVTGWYTGIRPGEQFTALGVWVGGCRQAVEFRGEVDTGGLKRHMAYIGRLEMFFCPRGIVFSGDEFWVNIGVAGFEHEDSMDADWAAVYDIDDASNYGRGFIGWHVTEWTTGPEDTLLVNGGSGLSLYGAFAKRWKLSNVVDIPTGTNPSTNPSNGRRLYAASANGHLSSRDSSGTVFDYEDHSTLAPTTFTFPTATSPAQTTDGSAVWDSDDDILTVGDGASRKSFGYLGSTTPVVASGAGTSGTSKETSRADHVHPAATTSSSPATVIIGQETRIADGSTTTWALDNDFEPDSVQAFNLTSGLALTVTEGTGNSVTISAAGSAGNVLSFAYAPVVT